MTAKVELVEVDGRRLKFEVRGYDDLDLICQGTHERFIIDKQRFDQTIEKKRAQLT